MIPTLHPVSPRRRWSALALIVTAQFMVILDVAIVNVALPSIKTDLGFSRTGLQWVITAYAILFGGTLLLGGRLADLLGRRRMFIAGLALFALSSLLCGFAWSSGSLVGFRALQGLGGALLAPAALSLLMTTFAEGRERNLALGIYGAASGSGAAAGVLLGGVLTSYLGWSWIFFVNVPVGLAAIALTPYLLRESRADTGAPALRPRRRHLRHRRADAARLRLTRATSDGWSSPVTVGLLSAAVALVAAFVAIESRSRSPLLPLRIFRLRALSAANATMAHRRSRHLLGVLRPHALRAGRPPLLGSAKWRRLRRLRTVGGRRFEPRAGGRRAGRRPGDSHLGPRACDDLARPAHAATGRRPLLLESVPRLRSRRNRAGLLLRAGHDRQPRRRRPRRRRRRLGAREHEPADRRRDRSRDRQHHRRQRRVELRERPLGRGGERPGHGQRLPDVVRRARWAPGRRDHHRRRLPPAGSRAGEEAAETVELQEAA